MLVHRALEIDLDAGATPDSVVARVHAAMGGDVGRQIWFFVPESRGVSNLPMLLRAAPSLAPLVREGRPNLVSNLLDFDRVQPPPTAIDAATLERAVHAISTELARSVAWVFWGPVPALQRTDAAYAPARDGRFHLVSPYGAEIMMHFRHSTLELQVGVLDDAPPPDATALPPLPHLVAELGPSRLVDRSLFGSPEEIAAARALDASLAPIEHALADRVRDGARTASYPHALADDAFVPGMLGFVDKIIAERLAPLGYRVRARRWPFDPFRFTRRTARDNELVIEFMRNNNYESGWSRAQISLLGPLWGSPVYVPLAPGVDGVTVWTDDTMRRVADNLAFAAKRIEDELLAVVEPARPSGCAWYARDAT